jgi:benzoate-CoA ligase
MTVSARTIEDLPERFNAAVVLIAPNLGAGRGDKIAVLDHRGPTSYAGLSERIDRMANGLRNLGLLPEQRVLLCLLDTVDFPIAFLGAIKAGVVPVPLNTLLMAEDYRWILENSVAAAVIVSDELTHHWREIARDNPEVRFISSGEGPWQRLDILLAAASPKAETTATYRDDVAFWLYTSGSTGRPKAAMHVHSSIRLTANLFGQGVVGYREDDVVLSIAKQFFAYGLGNALIFPYAAGATAVLHKDRATPQAITALMKQYDVTVLNGVPTFFAGLLASSDAPTKEQVPHLRMATSAGECLPAYISEAFRTRYGADIIDGLGSTEMLHVYLSQQPGEVRVGCTGRAVAGYELRIVGDDGEIAGIDELGELQVNGPTAAIGYWRNHAKSSATFVGKWTRTGDRYSCDADGWYNFGGRSDDMLKVGGIYVSPTEIEQALACHEIVLEAAVIGAPDEGGLIKPCAYVVLKAGHVGDDDVEALLKAHVKRFLARYKYPRRIVFMDELPKTASGKIQRFRLRDSA